MVKLKIKIRFIALLFALTSLLAAQSDHYKGTSDSYEDSYSWQEKENFSSNDSVLSVLGRWAWGPCVAVDADSNFAYIGNGSTFHVLDISDPSSPVIVGEYLTEGFIYDIELRDNIAFVCTGGGLLILDISNPSSPQKISEISLGGLPLSFALEDSFAYVTTFSGAMWLVDISDISNPYLRNVIGAGGEQAFCVEAKDRYVYIGNFEWPPMVIVDATNPDSLRRVDFEVGGWGYSAYIKDTLLFVGVHGYLGTNYFKIYNISNAASPQFIGQLDFAAPEDVASITVSKNGLISFIGVGQKIYSVDISDPTQPQIIDEFEKQIGVGIGGSSAIAFSQNSILAAYGIGLLSLDVSQPDSLKFQSFFPTGGPALEMDSKDSLAFVACGLSGMWILDISNPEKPQAVSNVNTNGYTADVVVEDTLAYIVNWAIYSAQDTARGLWIIDISNIARPNIISHYKGITNFSTNTAPNSIAKSGNLIFITQQPRSGVDSILQIIDVSDIYEPEGLGILVSDHNPKSTSIKDTILFLATRGAGLRIIDIKDPLNPVEINVFSDSSHVSISDVYDDLLYVNRTDTFFVLNISNPAQPHILGWLGRSEQGSALNLEAIQDYVYMAGGGVGGGVIDVSDPAFPIELTSFTGLEYSYDVEAIGNVVLFSDRSDGVWLLRNNLITSIEETHSSHPEDFQLLQNYPNPFNPATTIEFTLPTKEKALIEVFDLLGRRVKTLLNAELNRGTYKINFDASELSSGIYFYRLSAGRHSITRKMIVLQ